MDDNKHPDGLSDTGENGNWYYYKDGKIATDVTTVAQNALDGGISRAACLISPIRDM